MPGGPCLPASCAYHRPVCDEPPPHTKLNPRIAVRICTRCVLNNLCKPATTDPRIPSGSQPVLATQQPQILTFNGHGRGRNATLISRPTCLVSVHTPHFYVAIWILRQHYRNFLFWGLFYSAHCCCSFNASYLGPLPNTTYDCQR